MRRFPGYEVSDSGRVRSLKAWRGQTNPRILATALNRGAYPQLQLVAADGSVHTHRVHVLVAEAFIGPRPYGEVLRHLNGDPVDNRLSNLAYGTAADNARDSVRHGTHAQAAKTHCASGHAFTPEDTYQAPDGHRHCRPCNRREAAAYRARRRTSPTASAA